MRNSDVLPAAPVGAARISTYEPLPAARDGAVVRSRATAYSAGVADRPSTATVTGSA